MPRIIVTGSSGLVGSHTVRHFCARGDEVHGIDNNMRRDFFGPGGDTTNNRRALESDLPSFTHHELDIRNRAGIDALIERLAPDALVHCAAQPSHDLAARRPFDDFDVNAVGTMNLLEAMRRHADQSPFALLSTNKVYGDVPNELPLVELETRFDYALDTDRDGIDESMRIDRCKHSLFGASKVAADVMAQEYGRYFSMPVGVFRGGCLTGGAHAGVELHGFLSYLAKQVVRGGAYTVYGHGGKQVRDNIHGDDVARAIAAFIDAPRPGEVYNIGGGRERSVSIVEAIEMLETRAGTRLALQPGGPPREGDHVCYITNLGKLRRDYPKWSMSKSLDDILDELVDVEQRALATEKRS